MIKRACMLAVLVCSSAAADDGVERATYDDGKPRREVTKKAGVKHGVQTLWTTGGGRSTTTFVGGVEHGPAASYFDNGHKMYEGEYTWGLKSGTWNDYDIHGELLFTKPYLLGKKHGVVTQYGDGSGPKKGQRVKVRISHRVFGVEHGDVVEYWHNGELNARGRYVGGKKHGTWTYYTSDGTHSRETRWACGKKLDGGSIETAAASDGSDASGCGPVKISLSPPRTPSAKAASMEESLAATRARLQFEREACEAQASLPGVVLTIAGRPLRCGKSFKFRSKNPGPGGVRG